MSVQFCLQTKTVAKECVLRVWTPVKHSFNGIDFVVQFTFSVAIEHVFVIFSREFSRHLVMIFN